MALARVISATVTRTWQQRNLDRAMHHFHGTAINGVHYLGSTNTFTWNDGDVSSRTINVPLINDGSVGGTKQFYAKL